MIQVRGDCKHIRGRGRERGCGQGDGGRDSVAYYTVAVNSNVWSGNEAILHNFYGTVCPLRDSHMYKNPCLKQVAKNILCEKDGSI